MLLTFARKTPWGEPTDFVEKIKTGKKKHTFRKGFRWLPGMRLDTWDSTPRVVRPKVPAEKFWIPKGKFTTGVTETGDNVWSKDGVFHVDVLPACSATEVFEMRFRVSRSKKVNGYWRVVFFTMDIGLVMMEFLFEWNMKTKEIRLIEEETKEPDFIRFGQIAKNDGLTAVDFLRWFMVPGGFIRGQVIHWTDDVYDPEEARRVDEYNGE